MLETMVFKNTINDHVDEKDGLREDSIYALLALEPLIHSPVNNI